MTLTQVLLLLAAIPGILILIFLVFVLLPALVVEGWHGLVKELRS